MIHYFIRRAKAFFGEGRDALRPDLYSASLQLLLYEATLRAINTGGQYVVQDPSSRVIVTAQYVVQDPSSRVIVTAFQYDTDADFRDALMEAHAHIHVTPLGK